jgi:hypothetical protein
MQSAEWIDVNRLSQPVRQKPRGLQVPALWLATRERRSDHFRQSHDLSPRET